MTAPLSLHEWHVAVMALEIAAEQYREDAKTSRAARSVAGDPTAMERIAIAFDKQAADADALRQKIENLTEGASACPAHP